MRTEPSFSAEPDDRLLDDVVDEPLHRARASSREDADAESPQLADYRQRFGLSADPFADDPHFPFYSGAARRQVLDQLLHLCQFSSNLLVVSGDYAVGKTRMAQALIDALDEDVDIGFVEGQVNSTYDSLMAEIAEQFELDDENAIATFLRPQTESDGRLVLIVDDAHHLTDDVLLDLIALISPDAKTRVHLVLFAEPHLLTRLESFDVPNVLLSDFFLEKFSLSEAVDYLNFRMEMADYLGPELFTEAKVESWWRRAQGQLLLLHEFAEQRLLESVSSRRSFSFNRKSLPLPHIIGASVLGGSLLMYVLYGMSGSSKESPKIVAQPVPINKMIDSSTASVQSLASVSVVTQASSDAFVQPVAVSDPPEAMGLHLSTPASVAVSSVAASVKATGGVVKQSVVPLVQTNSIQQNVTVKSQAISSIKNQKSSEVKAQQESKPVVKDEVKATAKVESKVVEKTKPTAASGKYSDQEKTLLSWPDSDYTLQIAALSSEKAAHEFIAEQSNKKELFVFKTKRQDRDWFVVVSGRFPSSLKAKQFVSQLPESQRKTGPWPREVKSVQSEIRNNN